MIPEHLDRFLSKLSNVKPDGKGWKACCPAHGDERPSLGISLGSDSRILLNCRSKGCGWRNIIGAMNLPESALFAPKENGYRPPYHNGTGTAKPTPTYKTAADAVKALETSRGKRSAMWPYHDVNGVPVGAVVRWDKADGKDILPLAKFADGWKVAAMAEPRPLYGLPELKDAALVVVTEGEKAADAAKSIGFIATTSAGGALAWSKTDWTPLAGKDVWILPDNDVPGRRYGSEIAQRLAKLDPPARVKIIDLPDLPVGGDVVDWIAAHGDAAEPEAMKGEIEKLAEAPPSVTPNPPPAAEPRYTFITTAEFMAMDCRLEWAVKNAMVRKEPLAIGGQSKTLKTNVLIDLCVSLATATPFLGHFDVPRKMRVAIASGESGKPTLQETCRRVCRAKGIDPESLGEYLRWEFNLPILSDATDMGEFVGPLSAFGTEFVALDPLYLMMGAEVDEKSIFKMGGVLRNVGTMLVGKGIQPGIVHHANRKLEKNEPMGLEHLAYSGLEQFCRQFLLLSRREAYQHDGNHNLWLTAGGSAGFTGLYGVDIFEGVQGEDFTGRVWEPAVSNVKDLKQNDAQKREVRKVEDAAKQKRDDETTVLRAIDSITGKKLPPTVSRIRDQNTLSDDRVKSALGRLVDDGILAMRKEDVPIGNGATREADVYRRKGASGASGASGFPDVHPPTPDVASS